MDSYDSTPMPAKRLKITQCLGVFKKAEGIRCARNWNLRDFIRGQLKEEAFVWTSFVKLSCGMEKTRPVSQSRGQMQMIPQA